MVDTGAHSLRRARLFRIMAMSRSRLCGGAV